MTDSRSIAKLQQLHPKLRAIAVAAYNLAVNETPVGVHPYIIETYRSFAESDALYKQGRSLPGPIVSNAPAGHSWHNYGLALDFGLMINGKESYIHDDNWMKVISIFESHGFYSGLYFAGSFKDPDHLENHLGQTIKGLLTLHNEGKFIPGTTYVDF